MTATRTNDGRATQFASAVNPTVSPTYDDQGHMTQLGAFDLEYDAWQQLTTVHTTTQDYHESYVYDFAGRLVGVISADGHMDLFLHDGPNPVETWRASNTSSVGAAVPRDEYFWGPGTQRLIAARTFESGGDLLFVMTDERNSIVGLYNYDDIEVVETRQHDPDGRVTIRHNDLSPHCSEWEFESTPCTSSLLPHFGYTGAYRSSSTGLYRFGARWYSPRVGQFISPDPLWYVDSFDLYAYAAFDPINRWDPSGLASSDNAEGLLIGPRRSDGLEFTPVSNPGADGPGPDEPFSERYPGPGTWLYRLGNWFDDRLDRAGDANRSYTQDSLQSVEDELDEGTTNPFRRLQLERSRLRLRAWEVMSPQSGDEFRLELAIAPLWMIGRMRLAMRINLLPQSTIRHVSGSGTNLIREVTTSSGRRVRLNTGHGFHRSHRGPDGTTSFSDTNLTADQVDRAIANDVTRRMDAGAQIPVGGNADPPTFSVVVGDHEVGYRAIIHPHP